MYTFSQLLARNILLGVVFVIVSTALSVFFLAEYTTQKHEQHQAAISAFAQQLGKSKELANVLRKSEDYSQLTINSYDGEKIYSYSNPSPGFTFPMTQPPAHKVSLSTVDLMINYQLNTSKDSLFVLKIIFSLTGLIILLVVVAAQMSVRKNGKFMSAISHQIKKDLSLISSNDTEVYDDLIEIPELKTGIAEIKQLIEKQVSTSSVLEQHAYTDHLTGLDNRNRFVQYYESLREPESATKFGVLVISRCSELQTVNQIHGYHEGDNYIKNVASLIQSAVTAYRSGRLFKLSSSDFATILPNITLKEAENFANDLTQRFNEFQQSADLDSVAYTGLVYFDQTKPLGELLALVDTGISIAQTQHINAWYIQKDSEALKNTDFNQGNQNWRQEIDNVIDNQRISLLVQPIQPTTRNSKVYGEVLARFLNSNDEMLPTASFIAMAEKLDKITAVDKLIIETAINEIISKNIVDQSFGINVSARSISDEHFLIWLERKLLREASIAPRIIFEITEFGLQQNIKTSKRFIDLVHRAGSRVTVERFGVGLTSFKFFRDLKPDFIKMDSTYTRDIDDDKNNQYFLRVMVDLAHRLSITVLAESVESQEEKHTLERLFIDGCQGFYIGKPKPI
ncbi:EAL domain-containing protein [Thalassotalea euphylliae]|uniref:EAL domain-containing protein n=1 Tax=Thalassotalea euphylliae TaxID=1655234 RepID=A0A3E0UH95_9GAMM|nr:GGDEF domain-containing protein [Thalassotalea euphylliae]REL35974.1 EAL domain-containing protein [Thalassotalea euphylliae]